MESPTSSDESSDESLDLSTPLSVSSQRKQWEATSRPRRRHRKATSRPQRRHLKDTSRPQRRQMKVKLAIRVLGVVLLLFPGCGFINYYFTLSGALSGVKSVQDMFFMLAIESLYWGILYAIGTVATRGRYRSIRTISDTLYMKCVLTVVFCSLLENSIILAVSILGAGILGVSILGVSTLARILGVNTLDRTLSRMLEVIMLSTILSILSILTGVPGVRILGVRILGVSLLVLILETRSSVHLHLLWYNATGNSLRPCNMLKAQYYSQNLRGALFISKDAPDGCWSYHPEFALIGQERVNSNDLQDEFEVSGYVFKFRYEYPMSVFEVTMRGEVIKSMEADLAREVHAMFIRLIRRWKCKTEDGVFYGMQRVWGVNVTHCLDVEELYKLLVEGHVPVQYVNGPYTKALVMGEREILENIIKVIMTIISFFGVMYVNYGGHMVVNGMALILSLIVGGLFIRTLHLSTYMDVESKIFSYKYLRWFKYWEYRGQVLCPDRYCMEVMGHPVHVEGGEWYAELTRSNYSKDFGDSISNAMVQFMTDVPLFRIEIDKCDCYFIRFSQAPGYVSFYIVSKVHDATRHSYRRRMSVPHQKRFVTLLTRWGEGMISFVSSKEIKEGNRSAHCTSLLDIFLWFVDEPYRSLDDIPHHDFRVHKLGCGFENGLWLVHDG